MEAQARQVGEADHPLRLQRGVSTGYGSDGAAVSMPKRPLPTEPPTERAFLVGVEVRGSGQLLGVEDSLAELALLADTAGLQVVGETYQKIARPDPNTFIGSGKPGELKDFVEETLADVVVFDDELSPRHQRELEGILNNNNAEGGIKVLDRTALILDIFAQHAHTREGALQVDRKSTRL